MQLYKLTEEYTRFVDAVDSGEIPEEAILDTLDAISGELNEKAENIALVIKNLRAEAEAIKAEEVKLKERREAKEREAERIKFYLSRCMQTADIRKLETPTVRISFRRTESVEIEEGKEADFVKWAQTTGREDLISVRTEVKPVKAAIKDLIKAGDTVAFCTIREKQNIQIQ